MADVSTHSTLPTGLISYWELEEASGTRLDSTASGNDLDENYTVTQGTGKQGNCADLESSNGEYLSISDASQTGLDLSGDFSFSFWTNLETVNLEQTFFDKWVGGGSNQRSYQIRLVNSGADLYVDISSNGLGGAGTEGFVSVTSTSSGTWYHWVVTFDASAGEVEVWRNNVSQGTATGYPASISNGSAELRVGGTPNMDGLLDEVGVWSKVLSPDEIGDLYNSGDALPYLEAGGGGGGFAFSQAVVIA